MVADYTAAISTFWDLAIAFDEDFSLNLANSYFKDISGDHYGIYQIPFEEIPDFMYKANQYMKDAR